MSSDSPLDVLPFPTPEDTPVRSAPVRDARWVLKWTAAVAVIGWAAVVLGTFACQLVAEQHLARAAAAGLREACCDRATSRSVEQTVRRRLAEQGMQADHVSIAIGYSGTRHFGVICHAAGDPITVSLSVPADSVLPVWLQKFNLLGQRGPLVAWAHE